MFALFAAFLIEESIEIRRLLVATRPELHAFMENGLTGVMNTRIVLRISPSKSTFTAAVSARSSNFKRRAAAFVVASRLPPFFDGFFSS